MRRENGDNLSMKTRILALNLTILTGLTSQARAAERYEYYNGIRGLGMGGAQVATVNDETAMLVNPAGLGRLRDYYITIVDPEAGIGAQAEAIMGTDVMKVTDPQATLEKTNANLDKHLHMRGQVFPSIVLPNFGIGLFGRTEVNAESVSETNTYKYHYTNDWAGVIGANIKLFNGIIKLGANARLTNHATIRRDDLATNATGLTVKSLAKEGIGVGSDAGIMIAAPTAWLPTIGAVYRDVGRTTYTLRDGMFLDATEKPDSTPSTLDVAIAIHPIVGKRARSTWTVEYRDAMSDDESETLTRRIHGGVEFNFADAFFIRGGMNQGYWTAGMELAIINYQFQAAAYGEEIGTKETPREDRRYVVKFAFRF